MSNIDKNIPQKVLRLAGTPGNEEKSTKEQRISGIKRLVTVGAVALAGLGIAGQIKEANAPDTRPRVAYTVKPGDTLWSIAEQVDPNGDNRATVDDLEQHVNPVDDKQDQILQPGDVVDVPAESDLGKQIVASQQDNNNVAQNG
jgi:nucleoid-associated protein YgaU